jgi:hypothetical protein
MYAFCQDMPGISVEEQAEFSQLIDPTALRECIAHVVGPIDGGCRMIDVWESEDSYRRFQKQHLYPALQRWAEQQPLQDTRGTPSFTVLEVAGAGYPVGAGA